MDKFIEDENKFQMVKTNIDTGLENNPEMGMWTAGDIARDLLAYSPDFENSDFDDVLFYVKRWKHEHKLRL